MTFACSERVYCFIICQRINTMDASNAWTNIQQLLSIFMRSNVLASSESNLASGPRATHAFSVEGYKLWSNHTVKVVGMLVIKQLNK